MEFREIIERDEAAGEAISQGLWWERGRMWSCTDSALEGLAPEQRKRLRFEMTLDVIARDGTATVHVVDGTFPDDLPEPLQDCYLRAWDAVQFETQGDVRFAYRFRYPVRTWRAKPAP